MLSLTLSLTLALVLTRVEAWSGDSHKIVAKLAGGSLSRKAARFVINHIRDCERESRHMRRVEHSLVSASLWADTVDWSKELHFSNTVSPGCDAFEFGRDCPNGRCVVSAINNYTERASCYSLSQEERTEAIKFLVHLIADVHNPMHVGFKEDRGGNRLGVILPSGAEYNLHEVWDYYLLDDLKGGSAMGWRQFMDESMPKISKDELAQFQQYPVDAQFASALATETATKVTCTFGYREADGELISSGSKITPEYMLSRRDIAWAQLVKSAARLAQVLEHVASEFYRNEFIYTREKARSSSENSNRFSGLLEEYTEDLEDFVFEIDDRMESIETLPVMQEQAERPAPAKKQKDGEHPVIIKRDGMFYITRRRNVVSDEWTPTNESLFIQFTKPNNKLVGVVFETALTNGAFPTPELSLRILTAACGGHPPPWTPVEPNIERGFFGIFATMYLKLDKMHNIKMKMGQVNFDPSKVIQISPDAWSTTQPIEGISPQVAAMVESIKKHERDILVYVGKNTILLTRFDLVLEDIRQQRKKELPLKRYVNYWNQLINNETSGKPRLLTVMADARMLDGGFDLVKKTFPYMLRASQQPENLSKLESVYLHSPPFLKLFSLVENFSKYIDTDPRYHEALQRDILAINNVARRNNRDGVFTIEVVFSGSN